MVFGGRMRQPDTASHGHRLLIAGLLAAAIGLFVHGSTGAATAESCAILVSPTGTDVAGCGSSQDSPCRTIDYGISRAVAGGYPCVFIRAGTYNEIVVPVGGVDLIGGFDSNWVSGPYSDPAHEVRVIGGLDTAPGYDAQFLTVRAHSISTPTRIANLILQGPNAPSGLSSYVVHAIQAQVTLENVRLQCGNASAGSTGSVGTDAVIVTAALGGTKGGNGNEFSVACDNLSRGGGGSAGTNSCSQSPSLRAMNGGAGGAGGTMDTDCSFFSPDHTARAGLSGSPAALVVGSAGLEGAGGPANAGGCGTGGGTPGGAGDAGFIANGGAGTGGSGGHIVADFWYGFSGSTGATGENGSGGGGGGGGGGCDDGVDAYGAGGGGGGAGGCAARGGGAGGGAAGGTFGVMAISGSIITMTNCVVIRGSAGNGGAGGAGGRGQSGGPGGAGGLNVSTSPAGAGGNGAHGGHGGGGGGGAGGFSYAILRTLGSVVNTSGLVVSGGASGAGGAGGLSAPAAPSAERDGSDGGAGTIGQLGTELDVPGSEPARVRRAGEIAARGAVARPANALRTHASCDINCVALGVPIPGPGALDFAGVFPNPIAGGSRLHFTLPQDAEVRIELFDPSGRRMKLVCDRVYGAGPQTIDWTDVIGGSGGAAGVYLVRLETLGRQFVRRAVVLH